MNGAITKQEMIEVLDMYFNPLFQIFGAVAAVVVIAAAYYLVINPFIRKVR